MRYVIKTNDNIASLYYERYLYKNTIRNDQSEGVCADISLWEVNSSHMLMLRAK